jgi:competence protein ComEC
MRPNQPTAGRSVPLFKIFICLIVGIMCQYQLETWHWVIALLGIILPLLVFQFLAKRTASKYRYKLLYASVQYVLFVLVGYSLGHWSKDQHRKGYYNQYAYNAIRLVWGSDTKENDRWFKSIAQVSAVRVDSTWITCHGKPLVYYDKQMDEPSYGDQFIILGKANIIPKPEVPGSFDYNKYMANKDVHGQVFVRQLHVLKLDESSGNQLIKLALASRKRLDKYLSSILPTQQTYVMVKALLLGDRSGMDRSVLDQYANIGVVHVLAVSGLHVGGIYLLLGALLQLLGFRQNRPAAIWITIIILWVYALITGLSASVCRASLMFTLYGIGRLLSRKVNVLNIWAASGIILLIINPLKLFDVGFQLSFLAVLGILVLYKPIHHIYQPDSWFIRKIWSLVVVSTAAQLFTFPLLMYYFHQVSLIFLLSNLVIVPLVTVLFYGSLLAMCVGSLPWMDAKLGVGIDWLVALLNRLSHLFNKIPLAYLEDIYITPIELPCYFSLVIFIVLLAKKQIKLGRFAFGTVLIMCFISGIHIHHKRKLLSSGELIFCGRQILVRDGDQVTVCGATMKQDCLNQYLAYIGIVKTICYPEPIDSLIDQVIEINKTKIALVKSCAGLADADMAFVADLNQVSWSELVDNYQVVYLSDEIDQRIQYKFLRWFASKERNGKLRTRVVKSYYSKTL